MRNPIETDLLVLLADMVEAKPTRWRICVEAGAEATGLTAPELVELVGVGAMADDAVLGGRESDPRRLALYEHIASGAQERVRTLGRLGAQFVNVSP